MEEAGDGQKTSSQDARGRRAQAQGRQGRQLGLGLLVCLRLSFPFVFISNIN